MRIVSLLFGENKNYEKCSQVLEYTAQKYCPNWEFDLRICDFDYLMETYKFPTRSKGHDLNNAIKTKMLRIVVEESEVGELLCLLDVDTFITGCFDEIQELDFDLAVTNKEGKQQKAPINTGVMFVRVSDKIKKFFSDWDDEVQNLLANPRELKVLKRTYLGINQSGLSRMMAKEHEINIKELPGSVWNSTTVFWPEFGPKTKVVHVLGTLRMCVFLGVHNSNPKVNHLKKLWQKYSREMKGQGV